jgi:murein DD-endopeptidase MepM/ murein hydrolase activator NlpD
VNYSPFLKNRSKLDEHHTFRFSSKRKNSRIFLISSVISIAVLTTAVNMFTHSNLSASANKQINTVNTLALPEIAYNNEVLTAGITFTETEQEKNTTVQAKTSLSDGEKQNKVTPSADSDSAVVTVKTKSPVTNNDDNNQVTVALTTPAIIKAKASAAESKPVKLISQTQKTNNQVEKVTNPSSQLKIIKVKKGDTLSGIFKTHDLSISTLYKIINSGKEAKQLTRIKPGQTFSISLNAEKQIEQLKYEINKTETLVLTRNDKNFSVDIDTKEIEFVQKFASGSIKNSLFSAGKNVGLDSAMIMKLAHIFGWDIDFALDIRKGDSFSVLYEEKFVNGKKIANGDILSAEFVNNGKVFRAIRYKDASGHTDYYAENGLSMRKAFLRTPVDFSRISSRFSLKRKHPVLGRTRAHKGVDYAAATGTPIKAVGDGKVIFKGRKGGYGRVVILQHGSKHTTLYAHMNAFNRKIKNGSRVKQGQIIGYVGKSGLATGPHLHYEFRVNGVHRNPLTVKLPSAAPIAKKYRQDFLTVAETMVSQLKLRKQETVAFKEDL